jgi:3-hydroxyisobutyrate dehydrogenase-like beta-hydroxyacid dehydrogenase
MTARSVALLGVGKMGAAFVERWRGAARDVAVWNRSVGATAALAGQGVTVASSAAEAATESSCVVTMLTDGDALREVMIDGGALAAMTLGSTLIDLSTVDVASSQTIAAACAQHGVHYVRGGVSGTPAVVRQGRATLVLSGPAPALDAARPVLDEITTAQVVVGDADQARIVKIAINSMLAGTMQLLAEATSLAEANDVDRAVFLDALDQSVVSSRFLTYKGAALRARDYDPTFTTEGVRKDVTLARDAALIAGVSFSVGRAVLERIERAMAAGYASRDFLALYCVQQLDSARSPDIAGDH